MVSKQEEITKILEIGEDNSERIDELHKILQSDPEILADFADMLLLEEATANQGIKCLKIFEGSLPDEVTPYLSSSSLFRDNCLKYLKKTESSSINGFILFIYSKNIQVESDISGIDNSVVDKLFDCLEIVSE